MPSIKVDGLDDVFARLKAIGGDKAVPIDELITAFL